MQRDVITPQDAQRGPRPRAPRSEPASDAGARPPPPAAPPPPTTPADDYKTALLKLIPGETVGVYTALSALAVATVASGGQPDATILLVFLIFGIVFNPIYLNWVAGVSKPLNIALSTLAFVLYVYAQGDWFASAGLHSPLLGAGLLIMGGSSVADPRWRSATNFGGVVLLTPRHPMIDGSGGAHEHIRITSVAARSGDRQLRSCEADGPRAPSPELLAVTD